MLQAYNKKSQCLDEIETKKKDVYVVKYEIKTEYENGAKITRRVPKKINITKLVNETKKMVKRDQASIVLQKCRELEKAFTK